ncbi:MAG: class I SAM-dependent methyltransferase [Geminicoccaceae bacterium]|nr:class I SAM-dependent methyltransferase [Geminicoccaceae bacterium]
MTANSCSRKRHEEEWERYDAAAGAGPPRPTVLFALERCAGEGRAPGLAVDLGCGTGRDAVPLLRRGWRVVALDRRIAALARLAERVSPGERRRLLLWAERIEDAVPPPCDLLIASFSLFLVAPEAFARSWERLRAALRPGGRIACQLLGPEDDWAAEPGITVHERAELAALLAGLEVERLEEERSTSTTPRGAVKHWHLWHLVARKP